MTLIYKKHRKWLQYNGAEVKLVDVEDVVTPNHWGKEGDWTPVLMMYKEIYMRNIQV